MLKKYNIKHLVIIIVLSFVEILIFYYIQKNILDRFSTVLGLSNIVWLGIITGLMTGLTTGLIAGLTNGFTSGLINGIISGAIIGIMTGVHYSPTIIRKVGFFPPFYFQGKIGILIMFFGIIIIYFFHRHFSKKCLILYRKKIYNTSVVIFLISIYCSIYTSIILILALGWIFPVILIEILQMPMSI